MSSTSPVRNIIETLPNGTSFEMIFVEGGTFMMGNDDESTSSREKPVHSAKVPDFFIGKYLVTQALWQAVMRENPSYFKCSNRPVENVSWNMVKTFIQELNKQTGKTYRLPSEAEWEYAACGGNQSKGFQFSGGNKLKEAGWYDDNSHSETKPVGLKLPNELGLYDMSGNVWEWCADVWHDNYEGAPENGSVWMVDGEQDMRVARGGSWFNKDSSCRLSLRYWGDTNDQRIHFGFRLAE